MSSPTVLELSVRELTEFVLRTGDLGDSGFSSPQRALAGTRIHQKIQKSRPDTYKKETRLEKRFSAAGVEIILRGRIDGYIAESDHLWLEEIKTIQSNWPPQPDPVHWGQAKIYAAMLGEQNPFATATVQLTYAHLHSGEILEFKEEHTPSSLQDFFHRVLASYLRWITEYADWREIRDLSIQEVHFPHGDYRPGQRDLSVKIYHAIHKERRLFANAPTGIGKTISALFPALKAMGENHVSKIFYLTSRTLGRQAAEKALKNLRIQGLRARSVTLTAKSKICFKTEGIACDASICPYAVGYYDRSHAATRDLLAYEDISRDQIENIARKHQVCPFELSLDASLWSDVIIGDYNYVFDPSVSLKRFFQEEPRPYVFLIDEAHHLGERCRSMFSASLELSSFTKIKKNSPSVSTASIRAARAVARQLRSLLNEDDDGSPELVELPDKLPDALLQFTKTVESIFVSEESANIDEVLLELYFQSLSFLRTLDEVDDHYRIWKEGSEQNLRLMLDCVDPSARIDRTLQQGRSAVFISATLLPSEYFATILGARPEDRFISLSSPFDSSHFGIFLADRIATDYKNRPLTYTSVAKMIHSAVQGKRGNYLAFFPSYQYLRSVEAELEKFPIFCRLLTQSSDMSETDREAFLQEFQAGASSSVLGLAVMGGIFGEAIDLVGERLIGTIIVSVGMPQICFERDLTKELFSRSGLNGFEYAYTFPGFNRVLQAVGRVIRTEEDKGIAVLIDQRFSESRYRKLMPPWWQIQKVSDSGDLEKALADFWKNKLLDDPIPLDAPISEA